MASEELFPNPLVKQVVFALDFANLFFLENKIGDFQIRVMKQFPRSAMLLRRPVMLTHDADPEKLREMVSDLKNQDMTSRVWQFQSEQGVTLEDIYRAVTELEQKIAPGQVAVIAADQSHQVLDEPADVAAALENLGL